VLAETRRLLGCGSARGAQLEDEGASGSSGAHWETRLFQGELMLAAAPFVGRPDKLPRLTLTMALLEDSGWYAPRWDAVPPLDFGAGAGCALLTARAEQYVKLYPAQELYCRPRADRALLFFALVFCWFCLCVH
jgi:leishmanolysin-like peptidase